MYEASRTLQNNFSKLNIAMLVRHLKLQANKLLAAMQMFEILHGWFSYYTISAVVYVSNS